MSSPFRLEAREVGHAFGSRLLFKEVSFHLEPGNSLAITGKNGSGKSTLLRILAGLLTPLRGSVSFRRGDVRLSPPELLGQIGYVAPYLHVYEELTARENLEFVCTTSGRDHAAIPQALQRVGLGGREDDRVETFSSGMIQRVKYATVIALAPPLLFLDEPTANLDATGAHMVLSLLQTHTQSGGIAIIATNEPEEAQWCGEKLEVRSEK